MEKRSFVLLLLFVVCFCCCCCFVFNFSCPFLSPEQCWTAVCLQLNSGILKKIWKRQGKYQCVTVWGAATTNNQETKKGATWMLLNSKGHFLTVTPGDLFGWKALDCYPSVKKFQCIFCHIWRKLNRPSNSNSVLPGEFWPKKFFQEIFFRFSASLVLSTKRWIPSLNWDHSDVGAYMWRKNKQTKEKNSKKERSSRAGHSNSVAQETSVEKDRHQSFAVCFSVSGSRGWLDSHV